MPATSKAQFRWLHAENAENALGLKDVKEWLASTGSPKKLPEHKKAK